MESVPGTAFVFRRFRARREHRIRLKLWKRGEKEPDEWLLDQIDPSAFAGGKWRLGLPVFRDAYPF